MFFTFLRFLQSNTFSVAMLILLTMLTALWYLKPPANQMSLLL